MAIVKKKLPPTGGGSGSSMGSATGSNRPLKANPGGMEMMNTNLNRPVTNTPPRVGGGMNRPVTGTPRTGGMNGPVTNRPPRVGGNGAVTNTSPRFSGNGAVTNAQPRVSGRTPGANAGSAGGMPKVTNTPPKLGAPRMRIQPAKPIVTNKPPMVAKKSKIPDYLNPALRKKKVVKKPIR